MPTASSSAASAVANRAASASDCPARPSVAIGGHFVNGSFSRATRPPSWSTLTHAGMLAAQRLALGGELGHLLRRFDVAAEQDHAAQIELARQRAQFHRDGRAGQAADQKLSNVASRR